LRRFCRFGLHEGYLERNLQAAIPPLRHYRLSTVPQGINAEDARKTLLLGANACTRASVGRG
jgi:hypothetical protein